MRKLVLSVLILGSAFQIAVAQGSLQQNFGSGANAFTIDFVTIGNPNNTADSNSWVSSIGSVPYVFSIGKYEINQDAINKANALGGLGITLFDLGMFNMGGNGASRPATGLSFYEGAKFVNFLNSSTQNQVAYKFDINGNFQPWSSSDAGFDPLNPARNKLAKYFIPTKDEWYKSAFGSPNGTWYDYATGSNTAPIPVSSGTLDNTAVYGAQTAPADVDKAGGLSKWGTMGQSGNVWEWTESAYDGLNDSPNEIGYVLGGLWQNDETVKMSVNNRSEPRMNDQGDYFGFRVATAVPEPSSLSLLALGGLVVALRRRR
jgi:formylglycine-generating enzyme required for sulfatase activity